MALGTPVSRGTGTGSTSATTGAFTPADGEKLYCFVMAHVNTTPPGSLAPTGGSLTWTPVFANVAWDPGSNPRWRYGLFRAQVSTSPGSMTVSCSSAGAQNMGVMVVGVTNASSDITNFDVAEVTTGGDPVPTLPTTVTAGSLVLGFQGGVGGADPPAPSGFTELAQIWTLSGPSRAMQTVYDDTSPGQSITWSTVGSVAVGIAIEVKDGGVTYADGDGAAAGVATPTAVGSSVALAVGSAAGGSTAAATSNSGSSFLDEFVGTNGTNLSAHTADTGETWSATSGTILINSNRIYQTASSSRYHTSKSWANPRYNVGIQYQVVSVLSGNGAWISYRFTDVNNRMYAGLNNGTGNAEIFQVVSGTATSIFSQAISPALSAGQTRIVEIIAHPTDNDKVALRVDGVNISGWITTAVTATGLFGVSMTPVASTTTGLHFERMYSWNTPDAGAGSAAGTSSASASGTSGGTTGAGAAAGLGGAIGAGRTDARGVGSAAGGATVLGVATLASVGSASGGATAGAVGAAGVAGAGAAAGAAAGAGVGGTHFSGTGAVVAGATAAAIGASTPRAVGSAAGVAAAAATGQSAAGSAGAAAGQSTPTSTGRTDARAVGSDSAAATAAAIGGTNAAAVGTSAGQGGAAAVGASAQAGVGSSAGTASVSGTSSVGSVNSGAGSASGGASAGAVGASSAAGVGSVAGVATGSAPGRAASGAAGVAASLAVVTGQARSDARGAGAAAAGGGASAASNPAADGDGVAAGFATATAVSAVDSAGVGLAVAGVSASLAFGRGDPRAVGNAAGSSGGSALSEIHASGAGLAQGTSTASATGPLTIAQIPARPFRVRRMTTFKARRN